MEELKLLWEEHESGSLDSREVDQQMLKGVIRSRSRSAIARIKRNIWLEILAIVLPLWLFLSWALYQENAGWLAAFPTVFLAGVSLAFYGVKLYSLNRSSDGEIDLLNSLRHKVGIMGQYLKIYALMGSVIIPLIAGGSIVWGFVYAALKDGKAIVDVSWSSWAWVGGTVLLYGVLSHLFFKWYIQKLYKGHYKELVACLEELQASA